MKASKFTDAQKAFVIKQGDEGTPVADICRKAGIRLSIGIENRPPYRRAKLTSFVVWEAVIAVVHGRGPRMVPRAVRSAGGSMRGRALWTHRDNRGDRGLGEGVLFSCDY
jgi:putative transposase